MNMQLFYQCYFGQMCNYAAFSLFTFIFTSFTPLFNHTHLFYDILLGICQNRIAFDGSPFLKESELDYDSLLSFYTFTKLPVAGLYSSGLNLTGLRSANSQR